MQHCKAPENQTMRRICSARAPPRLPWRSRSRCRGRPTPRTSPRRPVPANVQVPAGTKLFLVGHASGTQNYVCLPAGTGVTFVLFTPQATLFNESEQVDPLLQPQPG